MTAGDAIESGLFGPLFRRPSPYWSCAPASNLDGAARNIQAHARRRNPIAINMSHGNAIGSPVALTSLHDRLPDLGGLVGQQDDQVFGASMVEREVCRRDLIQLN